MKYKYNSKLELQHICLSDRRGMHFHMDEAVVLVREDPSEPDSWVVASFNDGVCNNASSYSNELEAWKFFVTCVE